MQIFRLLHVCDPSLPSTAPKGSKVKPLLDLLCPRFASLFSPGREIAVDEAISFKGRVSFKQYVKGTPTPWGIKAYTLADSQTGYISYLRLYFGKDTDILQNRLLHSTRVVCTLSQPLSGKNHALYCDRFYTSPELAVGLEKQGTFLTGTIMANRRGLPPALKGRVSLRRGDTRAYRNGRLLLLQWKDKRLITVLTTQHATNQVEVSNMHIPRFPHFNLHMYISFLTMDAYTCLIYVHTDCEPTRTAGEKACSCGRLQCLQAGGRQT